MTVFRTKKQKKRKVKVRFPRRSTVMLKNCYKAIIEPETFDLMQTELSLSLDFLFL